jgi:hypothetical protein
MLFSGRVDILLSKTVGVYFSIFSARTTSGVIPSVGSVRELWGDPQFSLVGGWSTGGVTSNYSSTHPPRIHNLWGCGELLESRITLKYHIEQHH